MDPSFGTSAAPEPAGERGSSVRAGRYAATHERIVEVASRALRREGYAGVGVADVMREAGLTHGGFYAHFKSREALLAAALERAGRDTNALMTRRIADARARGVSAFRVVVEHYLADALLDDAEHGCVIAALGSEMPRQAPALRASSAERVRRLVDWVAQALPPGVAAEHAMAIAGTLVGTLQLARALGPNEQGRAMLAAARSALLAQYEAHT